MKKSKWSAFFLPLFCGFLAALPLLLPEIPLLSFLLFFPFFCRLFSMSDKRLSAYYTQGLLFFQGYLMAAFSFFIAMYPMEFAGLSPIAAISVIFAASILLPLFQGCFLAFGTLLFGWLHKKNCLGRPLLPSLTAAAVITLSFYCQNFTWAGVPWAAPALGIASLPSFLGSASLFGSGFLTFLILFVNSLLAEAFLSYRACRDKASLLAVCMAAVLFISNLLCGVVCLKVTESKNTETITVALLQSDASVKDFASIDEEIAVCITLARKAAEEKKIDLMLWPESVIHHALENDKEKQAVFRSIATETGAIHIIGSFSEQVDEKNFVNFYNSLFVFYPDGTMGEEIYNKRRPVPFGEYLPMEKLFRLLIPALTEINMLARDTQPGQGSSLFSLPFGKVGGLICFDSIYPALARESTADGASLLLLSTNDSWFDGSAGKDIHFAHSILRAVENGRTVLRVGTTGITAAVSPGGRVDATLSRDTSDVLVCDVSLRESQTLYTQTGDLFMICLLAYITLYPSLLCTVRRKKKKGASL